MQYTERSEQLLNEHHARVTEAYNRRKAEHARHIAALVSLDKQLVHLYNEQADLATAMCRLNAVNNTFMPCDENYVDPADAYVPNPFAADHDEQRPEAASETAWALFGAMGQRFDIRDVDGDCDLVMMRRADLIAMLALVHKTAKKAGLKEHKELKAARKMARKAVSECGDWV